MTSTITDRVYGESASVAVKAPCLSVSVGVPLPLVGLGAVGGYIPNAGDRILVKDQADATANGIYNASAGAWARSGDFNGAYDCTQGTLIVVYFPNAGSTIYQLTTPNPIIGTTPLTFVSFVNPSLNYPQTPAEAAAIPPVVPTNFYINKYKDVPVERYGVVVGNAPGTEAQNTAGMNQAIAVAKTVGGTGGVILMPQGTIRVNATLLTGGVGINWQGSGKGQTFLKGVGLALDTPIIDVNHGSAGNPTIDTIFMRDFTLNSDNGLARGLSAAWVKGSDFDLYFNNLYNGEVFTTCFNNSHKLNAFQVGLSTVQLLGTCDGNSFYQSRFVGYQALAILGAMDTINLFGGDIEGVIAGGGVWNGANWSIGTTPGAGLYIAPGVGNAAQNVNCYGVHWEHINGYAIQALGNVANSVANLTALGCKIFGSHIADVNLYGLNAVLLHNVLNPIFEGNDFGDWGTQAFLLDGTEAGGRIENNTNQGGNVAVLSNQAFQASVRVANNFAGPQFVYGAQSQYAPLYGPVIPIDRTQGDTFNINVPNGVAFTLSNPINIATGQRFALVIRNLSGGAMGAVTFGAAYKIAAFVAPNNAFSNSAEFEWNGAAAVQITSWTGSVPN